MLGGLICHRCRKLTKYMHIITRRRKWVGATPTYINDHTKYGILPHSLSNTNDANGWRGGGDYVCIRTTLVRNVYGAMQYSHAA